MARSLMCKPSDWLDPHPSLGISLMDHLYNRLDGIYPNRWRAAFTGENAIANWRSAWAEAFIEEGITPHMIAEGIRSCRRKYDWPPSLTEFLKACKPTIDPESAFMEAVEQMANREHGTDRWTNPAIYWAAVEFGAFDLRHLSYTQAKARWNRIFNEKLSNSALDEVPPRREALPAPGEATTTSEEARRRLSELKAALTGGVAKAAIEALERQQ